MFEKHVASRTIGGMPGTLSSRARWPTRLPMAIWMYSFYRPLGHSSTQKLRNASSTASTPQSAVFSRQVEIAYISSSNPGTRETLYSERILGPLSTAAQELLQSFEAGRADPYHTLEEHLKSENETSLDVIRISLGAMWEAFFKTSGKDRAELIRLKNFGIARHVMLRIIDDNNLWVRLVTGDQRAMNMLYYFAIKENLDNLVVDWIKITDIDDELLHLLIEATQGRPSIFRNLMLKALIVAHTISHETRSMDQALTCLRDIMTWRQSHTTLVQERGVRKSLGSGNLSEGNLGRTAPSVDPALLSVWPSISRLVNNLCTVYNHDTDPALFDWLVAQIPRCKGAEHGPWSPRSKLSLQFMTARLALYHPVSPDSAPLVSMLRAIRTTSDQGDFMEVPNHTLERPFRRSLQRAWVVSKALARHDEAIWLKQVYQNTFSEPLRVENRADTRMPPKWKPSSA